MKRRSIINIILILLFFYLSGCQSKSPETESAPEHKTQTSQSELQTLNEQMAEQKQLLESIKGDVEWLKKTVEEARQQGKRPSSDEPQQPVSIDDDYIKGRTGAKLTLIEFSDFQCPFCARFYRETLPLIDRDYIQTGKIRMVYRDFPLDSIHKDAQKSAEAAQCAGEHGKYWEMHDKLFDNQTALSVDQIKKYGEDLGLPVDKFNDCLDSGKYTEEVQKDLLDGQAAGVQGTPTFYLGYTGKGKTLEKPIVIRGASPYLTFKQSIDKMLSQK